MVLEIQLKVSLPRRYKKMSSSLSNTMIKFKCSYGILLRCGDRYLIVQNRDSEAFIYFFFANIRKWSHYRFKQLFSAFSQEEKDRLLYMPFHDIYMDLYVTHDSTKHHQKYVNAEANYTFLHSDQTLLSILKHSFTRPISWIFPKGRIEKNETETECALREFEEETCLTVDPTLINPHRYIEYKQFKRFYNFELLTRLFIVDVPEMMPIRYQRFDNLIRSLSISNEILYATWAYEHELKDYLFSTLYHSLRSGLL